MGGVMDSRAAHGSADVELIDVIRDVVADVAPEELPLVAALTQLSPAQAGRRLARRTSRDDPLGFGMDDFVILVVPVIWAAVQEVVNHLATSAADGLVARLRVRLRRLFRRPEPVAPLPHFGPAELDEVRDQVRDLGVQAGMEPERAELLAYKVADRLAATGSEKRAT